VPGARGAGAAEMLRARKERVKAKCLQSRTTIRMGRKMNRRVQWRMSDLSTKFSFSNGGEFEGGAATGTAEARFRIAKGRPSGSISVFALGYCFSSGISFLFFSLPVPGLHTTLHYLTLTSRVCGNQGEIPFLLVFN